MLILRLYIKSEICTIMESKDIEKINNDTATQHDDAAKKVAGGQGNLADATVRVNDKSYATPEKGSEKITSEKHSEKINSEKEPGKIKQEVDLAPSQWANVLMAVIMAAIGLTFIFLCDSHQEVTTTVVYIGGCSFIIPGAYLILSLLVERKNPKRKGSVLSFMTVVCGLAAIALGIVMLLKPDLFKDYLVYLFGGLLILASAWQFDVMMRKNRGVLYPAWLVVAPVLLVAAGVVLCTMDTFKGEANQKWMLLVAGIGFTLFGLIGLFISYFALRSNHKARKLAKEAEVEQTVSGEAETTDQK